MPSAFTSSGTLEIPAGKLKASNVLTIEANGRLENTTDTLTVTIGATGSTSGPIDIASETIDFSSIGNPGGGVRFKIKSVITPVSNTELVADSEFETRHASNKNERIWFPILSSEPVSGFNFSDESWTPYVKLIWNANNGSSLTVNQVFITLNQTT